VLRIDIKDIPPDGLDLDEALKPADLHIQEGDDFKLEPGGSFRGRVELRDEDTVAVSGRLQARLGLACGRCLEPFPLNVDQKLELFLLPHREGQEEEDEVELSERDMVVGYYRDRVIDLGEMFREQLVLGIPMKRVCREDCKGLCPRCGINKNRESCECPAGEHEPDPRLASLGRLLGR
jgi:uncharacterized protein